MIRGQKVMAKGTNKVTKGSNKKPFAQLPNGGKAKIGGSKLPLKKAGA